MNSDKRREFEFNFTRPRAQIDFDYQAIRIRVYKNGDEHDPGKLITVTRREYKHWIIFLDALTRKLGTTTAIHKLYSVSGIKVRHFTELENNGEYVAVERGPFIDCNYGAHRIWTQTERKWTSMVRVTEGKPAFLSSSDTMDIYLKKEGYGSTTGLPYPLDGLSKSPNVSNLYLSGLSKEKWLKGSSAIRASPLVRPGFPFLQGRQIGATSRAEDLKRLITAELGVKEDLPSRRQCGGSLERLNRVGKDIWSEDNNTLSVATIRPGETKEKSFTREHSMSVTKLPRLTGIEDESQKTDSNSLRSPPKIWATNPSFELSMSTELPVIGRMSNVTRSCSFSVGRSLDGGLDRAEEDVEQQQLLIPLQVNQKHLLKPKEDDHLPPIKSDTAKETSDDPSKKDDARCPTRDYVRPRQIEKKEIEETKDVTEYAVIDKPLLPWTTGKGTVYEKKEMMREVIIEGSKPNLWPEMHNREERKTRKIVRTYEKVREYSRNFDDFDPDLVD